jgi:hypothetical protein
MVNIILFSKVNLYLIKHKTMIMVPRHEVHTAAAPLVSNLDARPTGVASFMTQPFYSKGKDAQYLLARRMVGTELVARR